MPQMKGKPLTWGPDGKGNMLAAATCSSCYAQVMGTWVKSGDKEAGQGEHRQAAIDVATIACNKHVCKPEQLKKIEEERTKALAEDKNLKAEDWEPKPFSPDYVPNEPPSVIH